MSYLRAPVKFMRLVEFAVALLAGSGLAALMADNCRSSLRKGLAFAAAGAAMAGTCFSAFQSAVLTVEEREV